MKYILFFILMIFFSCKNNKKEFNVLHENDIFELKYLKEYIEDYCLNETYIKTNSFNFLYNSLYFYKISDSSTVFICYKDKKSFLVRITKDSLLIYKEEKFGPESYEKGYVDHIYLLIQDFLEKGNYQSIDSIVGENYIKKYEFKHWPSGKLLYCCIWESKDDKFFIHYIYKYCLAYMGTFKYEKSIKNDLINIKRYKILNHKSWPL
jgi:hypothetical protein